MPDPTSSAKLVTVFGGSGFSAATSCRRWRSAATASASRCAGPTSPVICSRSAWSARSRRSRPISATAGPSIAPSKAPTRWSISSASSRKAGGRLSTRCRALDRAPSARPRAARNRERRPRLAIGVDRNLDRRPICAPRRKGETGVREAMPDAVIMRPSIVFGPEDEFFNRFAAMARVSPVLPLIGGGKTRFQPVFVGDVGEAIARAVDGKARPGTIYRAWRTGGPELPAVPGAHAWRSPGGGACCCRFPGSRRALSAKSASIFRGARSRSTRFAC